MTKLQIQKMKDTGILVLTKWQLFWHFSIIPLLLISPVYATVKVFEYYVIHTYKGVRPVTDIMIVGYPWLVLAIAFYFVQKRRLKFKIIPVCVDTDLFQTAAEQAAKELEWHFEKKTSNVIIAISGFNWLSWGERITIIRDTDRILINSICDPDNRPSVISWGMNKVNVETFKDELKKLEPDMGF